MDHNEIKTEIKKVSEKRLEIMNNLDVLKKELVELEKKLKENCVKEFGGHNMVRDWGEYDFHTHYECARCGHFT